MSTAEVKVERVLTVPTSRFRSLGYFQGFSANVQPYKEGLILGGDFDFVPRPEAENDPSRKQLIPYQVVCQQLGDTWRIYYYVRGVKQGESRLHAKWSIGVGGHINAEDAANGENPYYCGQNRELNEELEFVTQYNDDMVGVINDDSDLVGRVHLGIVHRIQVYAPCTALEGDSVTAWGFADPDFLRAHLDRFEGWSQICINHLEKILP